MSDPMIATIMGWGPDWAPRAWSLCDGQLLAISQNQALYSIIGTTYGGDGRTTFALPDLRGRAPVGWGHGPGLSDYRIGEKTGAEQHTMTIMEMPNHSHSAFTQNLRATVPASTGNSTTTTPGPDKVPAKLIGTIPPPDPFTGTVYADAGTANTTLAMGNVTGNVTIGNTGGNIPFSIVQPVLAISMIIALYGIFPSRG